MPKMIATKPQTYGTRTLAAGDEFDVEPGYVNTLVSLGRARLAGETSTKVKPTTTKAEPEPEPEDPGPAKSQYKTRRMKAGDK